MHELKAHSLADRGRISLQYFEHETCTFGGKYISTSLSTSLTNDRTCLSYKIFYSTGTTYSHGYINIIEIK